MCINRNKKKMHAKFHIFLKIASTRIEQQTFLQANLIVKFKNFNSYLYIRKKDKDSKKNSVFKQLYIEKKIKKTKKKQTNKKRQKLVTFIMIKVY